MSFAVTTSIPRESERRSPITRGRIVFNVLGLCFIVGRFSGDHLWPFWMSPGKARSCA